MHIRKISDNLTKKINYILNCCLYTRKSLRSLLCTRMMVKLKAIFIIWLQLQGKLLTIDCEFTEAVWIKLLIWLQKKTCLTRLGPIFDMVIQNAKALSYKAHIFKVVYVEWFVSSGLKEIRRSSWKKTREIAYMCNVRAS